MTSHWIQHLLRLRLACLHSHNVTCSSTNVAMNDMAQRVTKAEGRWCRCLTENLVRASRAVMMGICCCKCCANQSGRRRILFPGLRAMPSPLSSRLSQDQPIRTKMAEPMCCGPYVHIILQLHCMPPSGAYRLRLFSCPAPVLRERRKRTIGAAALV